MQNKPASKQALTLPKIHWIVIRGSHFTGNEWPVEYRKTRRGAIKAMGSLERYADPDHYFYVIRNDLPHQRWFDGGYQEWY